MKIRIAILGTPSRPEEDWSPRVLEGLRRSGYNGIQLNIAWSYRPNDEPLNLEDVIEVKGAPASNARGGDTRSAERLRVLRTRGRAAHQAGLRTLFHFGAPHQGRAGFDGEPLPQCISDLATLRRYADAVMELGRVAPEIDDLLVYTYDQDAWLCSEFSGCERCAGIPLHNRLPAFLNGMSEAWTSTRPGGRVWWEPWELSAGQALACIPKLDPESMGLMLHSSIGEVISAMPVDAFVRNAAAVALEMRLPTVVEVFLSSSNEEVEPWRHLPTPLVTLAQLRVIASTPGIDGVKEYFGLNPTPFDVNAAAASELLRDPELGDDEVLQRVAERFNQPWLPDFWHHTSRAYQLYPWDVSWFARQLGRSQPLHELTAATVRGTQACAAEWDTPAWRSTRGAIFMRTEGGEPHPWLLEDVGLRFRAAADEMERAYSAFERQFLNGDDEASSHMIRQSHEVVGFITRCRAYQHHIRATNVAHQLRSGSGNRTILIQELLEVLVEDLGNQKRELDLPRNSTHPLPLQRAERWVVPERLATAPLDLAIDALRADPEDFLAKYLLVEEDSATAGQFTLTSR